MTKMESLSPVEVGLTVKAAAVAESDQLVSQRRRYSSEIRSQQRAATNERIISAGVEIVREFPTWDWTNLTVGIVGELAGVSQRTVSRHFNTDRKLRDAVLHRLMKESGISLETMALDNFGNVVAQLFNYLSSFKAVSAEPMDNPAFTLLDQLRRDALISLVAREAPNWSASDRVDIAAILDIIWNLPPYERLTTCWGFESDRAINILRWLVSLIKESVYQGQRPGRT